MNQILQIANRPGVYLVPSASDPEKLYEVHGRTFSCDCSHYQFRLAGTYALCKHGKALKRYLESLAACSGCGGRGCFPPRNFYGGDNAPIICAICDGSGRRDQADPALLAVADAHRAAEALKACLDPPAACPVGDRSVRLDAASIEGATGPRSRSGLTLQSARECGRTDAEEAELLDLFR